MKKSLIGLFVMLLVLTGCRKDLCYGHDEHSPVVMLQVNAEWEREWERPYDCNWQTQWNASWGYAYDELRPVVPEGIRVRTYMYDEKQNEINLKPEGGKVMLGEEGVYDILFYNNDTEYIVYDGLTSSTRATATTRTVSRGGFRNLHEGERTMNAPDMLYGKYMDDYVAEIHEGPVPTDIVLRPLVYTYLIRYEFKAGIEYVALARGAIAGMAEKVYLHDGHTGPESATILFDCELDDKGAMTKVMTFGVPDFPGDHYNRGEEAENRYSLNLEVKLVNGETKYFDFDITEQINGQPRGGVIIVDGIEVEPVVVGGGFGVDIEGWGDAIDIPWEL